MTAEAKGYRSFLRLDAIVAEARRIADADGLSAVSMRSLADALDCTPRALYRHVAGKDEVLELLADAALGELSPPRQDLVWDEALVEFFVAMRELLVASAVAEIVAQYPVAGPNFRALGEAVAASLIGAGLPPDVAVEAVVALGQFTIGASMPGTGQRLHEAYRALDLLGEGHPTLGHVREHFVRDSAATHFRSALQRLLGAYRVP